MATTTVLAEQLQKLATKNALAQAYVLHGPDVRGQFALAKSLAHFLESRVWQEPGSILLDAKFIDGMVQGLGVDVAREFADFLYKQPVASPRRTLVVSSAEEFTPQAQNAILKIVEEPPSHALIILVLRDINSLLPALRSRLQALYVAPDSKGRSVLTEQERRARELVDRFFMSSATERSKLLKALVDEDKEADKSEQIVDTFVSALVAELAKKPFENVLALKQLLKRQTAMADYSTSKKLQLEAVLQYLK